MGVARMDAAAYQDQLLALLPTGEVWPREPGTVLSATLEMPAEELSRIDGRGADLIEESDPRTTLEMLTDWERVAGLPDPCTGPLDTIAERRARLVQKLTSIGGQSPAYFISLAEQLGYVSPSIEEFRPFTVDSNCNDYLYTDPWRFAWLLKVQEKTLIRVFSCDSGCDEYLRSWGDDTLECVINQLKPAHTVALFSYGNGS